MSATDESALRRHLVETARGMNARGLNQGTSGNVSARCDDAFLITPSGMPYDEMEPADIVKLERDGTVLSGKRPSSEWRMHLGIYRKRPEAGAILHAHSPYATALAATHTPIPPFHYMIAVAGGSDIRCAPYATFGTEDLAEHAVKALDGRRACLLANHGMICLGDTVARTLELAVEVETLAQQYVLARQIGEPERLSEAQIRETLQKFADYRAG